MTANEKQFVAYFNSGELRSALERSMASGKVDRLLDGLSSLVHKAIVKKGG